jgi:hypothetical protein
LTTARTRMRGVGLAPAIVLTFAIARARPGQAAPPL